MKMEEYGLFINNINHTKSNHKKQEKNYMMIKSKKVYKTNACIKYRICTTSINLKYDRYLHDHKTLKTS